MKRYIKSVTGEEKTFVRFGKRFKHGKSINYLAMNPRIKELYSSKLTELQYGYITEDEFMKWCNSALEDYVWEPNISCFYCDPKTNLPIVNNISQVKTLMGFIQKLEAGTHCPSFRVKGIQVGTGTDYEPLVNVTQEEEIKYNTDDLISVVISALADGFEIMIESEDYYADEFGYLGNGMFVYKDYIFMSPKQSFIDAWEYTGQVMDKFKYEKEVEIDPDDIQAIVIPLDLNDDSVDDIKDATDDWGDNIYDQPYHYENKYRIAVDIKRNKDIYICGSEDSIWDFTNDFPVAYKEIEPPTELVEKYRTMKFYE